ncbi:MAG: YggS family pyridoxal phosphate-dependent enzyme [Clostridia bacterium]|nr:YggS family pyridoxal phosphate-dependent enzyme [Clostridia bacterium]MBQ7048846.1 YggS family pyridoxal phosphate-dependent enzyme [Clostridia bacterium]
MDAKKDTIKANLEGIMAALPKDVTLLAATKTVSPEYINYAASLGLRLMGENRVNELLEKYDAIDKSKLDIHFIGALQSNKVKYIIDKVSMIHSVDRLSLAEEISRRALAIGKVMPVLVEVNIGKEESKSGVMPEDVLGFVRKISALKGISVEGLMAIPPKSENKEKNIEFLQKIKQIFIDISTKNVDNVNMRILSVGMSNDWREAIECGSNMVRIGSGIFGKRDYGIPPQEN